jgi:hypothetical protein
VVLGISQKALTFFVVSIGCESKGLKLLLLLLLLELLRKKGEGNWSFYLLVGEFKVGQNWSWPMPNLESYEPVNLLLLRNSRGGKWIWG